ncbi:vWA domain-containing protein [Verminephrobacter aporrectodeae]|uniref:MxaL protein n=1 Tax=Verminephrobacter aporrectodeae TaxID=1110389 RepID=UPI002244126E|nr:MxaL protein [Verminephrobacter aporrectodeae]
MTPTALRRWRRAWQRMRAGWPLALAMLLLALAVWPPRVQWQRPVFHWQVSFDITQSMNVEDVQLGDARVSRLTLARAAMRDALAALPCGSRVGWSVFADYRSLVILAPLEVCSHYEELLATLERIGERMRWANASNISKGVGWAVRGARSMGPGTAFVFLSDGQEAPPLRANDAPPMADITPGEVKGWLIGVGGDAPVPIPRTDGSGQAAGYWRPGDVVQGAAGRDEHLSSLREEHLRTLAGLVGADYRRLHTAHALRDALLDRRFAQSQPADVDLRWIPALLALLLLVWCFAPDIGPLIARRSATRPA